MGFKATKSSSYDISRTQSVGILSGDRRRRRAADPRIKELAVSLFGIAFCVNMNSYTARLYETSSCMPITHTVWIGATLG